MPDCVVTEEPMTTHVNFVNAEVPEGTIVLSRSLGRTEQFETVRARQILATSHADMGRAGFWFWNPRTAEPLTDDCEAAMKQMGPPAYLQWITREYGITLSAVPQSVWECELASRELVRCLPQYKGEKFIQ